MYRIFITAALLLIGQQLSAQQPAPVDPLSEGRTLFRLELASWNSTDLLKKEGAAKDWPYAGYFSYEDGAKIRSIYFSRGDSARVLTSITFDTTLDPGRAVMDKSVRPFTDQERNLYAIRQASISEIKSSRFFKKYDNTSFNIIPLNSRKVFVITASTQENEVVFGNDYLLSFDNDNKLASKKRIHKSLLRYPARSQSGDSSKRISFTYHTHLPATGDMFTSTDICTLLLYGRSTEWKSHMVMGAGGTYTWNIETREVEQAKK